MKIEIDHHRLMYHPERVSEWMEKRDCFPLYVEVGPTNRCNHNCVFCALDFLTRGKKEDINSELLITNLKDMSEEGVKSVMFAGEGEPLLHKDIGKFVEKAKKYGMDTARFFLLSLAAPDKPRDWSDKGIEGSLKFIKKIINYFNTVKIGSQKAEPLSTSSKCGQSKADAKIESKLNKSIKEVTRQIEEFNYNLSIIKIRELFNSFPKENSKNEIGRASCRERV